VLVEHFDECVGIRCGISSPHKIRVVIVGGVDATLLCRHIAGQKDKGQKEDQTVFHQLNHKFPNRQPTFIWQFLYSNTNLSQESLASGIAIDTAGQLAGFKDSRAVFKAASSGDDIAKRIVDRALKATVSAIWTIAHSFIPQRIIFGGRIMEDHFDLFASAARQSILNATMIPGKQVWIVIASLGANAGFAGPPHSQLLKAARLSKRILAYETRV